MTRRFHNTNVGWWLVRSLIVTVLLFGVATCVASPGGVVVSDVTDRSGYSIVAVDGAKPRRWRSSFVTVVPYVLVEPGRHRFELERDAWDSSPEVVKRPARLVVEADIQAGRRYILKWSGSTVRVAENEDS